VLGSQDSNNNNNDSLPLRPFAPLRLLRESLSVSATPFHPSDAFVQKARIDPSSVKTDWLNRRTRSCPVSFTVALAKADRLQWIFDTR
jgi:hypothetical protein